MFFIGIFGIEQANRAIGVHNNIICPACGHLTNLELFKSYTYLHVFFIPTFRWDVQYRARAACCGQWFAVEPETGRQFASGGQPDIQAGHLDPLGRRSPDGRQACVHCGADVDANFRYCPHCGRPR